MMIAPRTQYDRRVDRDINDSRRHPYFALTGIKHNSYTAAKLPDGVLGRFLAGGSPLRLALLATIGVPSSLSNASATGWSGALTPTLPVPAVTRSDKDSAFSSTSVSGPGQNALASFTAASGHIARQLPRAARRRRSAPATDGSPSGPLPRKHAGPRIIEAHRRQGHTRSRSGIRPTSRFVSHQPPA